MLEKVRGPGANTHPLRRVAPQSIVLFLHSPKKTITNVPACRKEFFKKQSFPRHKHIIGNLRCFSNTKRTGLWLTGWLWTHVTPGGPMLRLDL